MKKCAHPPCDEPKSPKAGFGLCMRHYGRRQRGLPFDGPDLVMKNKGLACDAPNCNRDAKVKGLCHAHWQQQRDGKSFRPPQIRGQHDGCAVAGCNGEHRGLGYCQQHYDILHVHGLDPARYEEILAEQQGVCAVCMQKCTSKRRLAVDHCHETGRIRGLLCHRCNRSIGLLGDSRQLLLRAADYLKARFDRRAV